MNERIKELAEQAGIFSGNFAGAGLYAIHNKDEVEKFSELIVKECARVAEEYVDAENNTLVETVHISSWRLQDAIKEHFGIE